jgi:hypothetical protein
MNPLLISSMVEPDNLEEENKNLRLENELLERSLIREGLDKADLMAQLSPKKDILPSDEEISKDITDINFQEKYIKYKAKYLKLKKMLQA